MNVKVIFTSLRTSSYQISIYPHVDNKGFMSAQGRVFIDDANSFDYRLNNNFIYDSLTLLTKSNILSFSLAPINVALSLNSVLVQGNGSHVSLPNINLDSKSNVIPIHSLESLCYSYTIP